jgi:hypothetical protein
VCENPQLLIGLQRKHAPRQIRVGRTPTPLGVDHGQF